MNRLKDKIAIITGAASGQGAAEAKLFAMEGARVVLTDLNDRAGRTLASQIGAQALFVHHDVSDEGSWKSVINATLDTFGKPAALMIVNIASGAGARGYPGLFAYAGSKWMVRGLSKCAAVDLAKSAIRVNTILPGLIDTPMLGENNPDYLRQLTQLVPMGRLGSAEEVAEAALYLASDAASYVSGAEIAVCGALMA